MRFIAGGIFIVLCSLHFTVSASENCAGKPVTEVVRFTLAAGASTAEFKLSAVAVEQELQKISGYQRRSLLHSDSGEWIDIVSWDKLSTAKAAAASMQKNSTAQAFFNQIDPNSVAMNYYCE